MEFFTKESNGSQSRETNTGALLNLPLFWIPRGRSDSLRPSKGTCPMLAPSFLTYANPTFFCKAPFSKYPQVSGIPLPWGSLPIFISSCYYIVNRMSMGSFSVLSLDLEGTVVSSGYKIRREVVDAEFWSLFPISKGCIWFPHSVSSPRRA